MLEDLHVKDVALLKEGWLEFGPGLTVLTGETGAGKTALLSALKLLVGERGSSSMVRSGSSELLVEGRFFSGEEELLVRRKMSADGRSKCYLDDQMATVRTLEERVGPLLDLHGQHEHQTLFKAATHVRYLDRWIGQEVEEAHSSYRALRAAYFEAQQQVLEVERMISSAEEEADINRTAVRDIEDAAIVPGEYEELTERLPKLQHSEQLIASTSEAREALSSEEEGVIAILSLARRDIEEASRLDESLRPLLERIEEAQTNIEDIAYEVSSYANSIEIDPYELQKTLDRLSMIDSILRNYGPRMEDVLERFEQAQKALAVARDSDLALEEAVRERDGAQRAYVDSAKALEKIRGAAVGQFEAAVAEALEDLEMSGAHIGVLCTDLPIEQWNDDGSQRIEFMYRPAPSVMPQPLSRIASGGEISRVMLALKGVLSEADETPTLVFDEIDAGIGGATALKVGARLKEISLTHQVIVVTHLAQVAAYADAHIVVEKEIAGDDVKTTVRALEDEERTTEIARMLSGSTDEAALAHARALVSDISS